MEQIVVTWYGWLSALTQGTAFRLQEVTEHVEVPLLTAVIFGLIGATAPCQLTTNLSALAWVSAHAGRGRPTTLAIAYVAGKVTVYTLVGSLVILAGLQLQSVSVPVVIVARKALGPLMVLVGFGLLGAFRLRAGFGQRWALWLRDRLAGHGHRGAYLLGVVFSFAFCPTLFWLFFGLTVPLALRSTGGLAFPGLFAVGASLPLLAMAAVVGTGLGTAGRFVGGLRRGERVLRVVAGTVLVLAGLHDTIVYWLL
jgi:cytochrome c biogenesis protein CcdA